MNQVCSLEKSALNALAAFNKVMFWGYSLAALACLAILGAHIITGI